MKRYLEALPRGNSFSNLKSQLEVFNETTFTAKEFDAVLNHLAKGNVFEKAKTLRDRFQLDKEEGTSFYVRFFNTEDTSQNLYHVTNQISLEGSYKNRFDVTLLVNGLPLVQIELKRSGIEIKEAFNQINRYQMHSFWSNHGLFQYVQLFVISNGVNTKYFGKNTCFNTDNVPKICFFRRRGSRYRKYSYFMT